MTFNSPKLTAFKILFKNKLYSSPDYNALKRIVEANGFTVIEYKKSTNSEYVSELINRIRVKNAVEHNDSFLYINRNLKFVFINSQVSYQDKCSLIRHELGHVCDSNFKREDAEYSKVQKEEFANEFACYLKNPDITFKVLVFIMKKWKVLLGMIAILTCILGLYRAIDSQIAQPTKSATNDALSDESCDNKYYVTSNGKKYHRQHCFIVKYKTNLTEITLKEAIKNCYEPCLICNPEE